LKDEKLLRFKRLTDSLLESYIGEVGGILSEAMAYSLFAGGKRLRAAILLGFCESYGGDVTAALPISAALECIHTFSLIHDDLPCMDDDDFRRGKPSCHKAFSESTAVLAGDALIIAAFELVAKSGLTPDKSLRIIGEFAQFSGRNGMLLGQQQDIIFEKTPAIGEDEMLKMFALKTCGLFKAASRAGVIVAGGSEADLENATNFAENLGLAFQIIDDILDVIGNDKETGKPIGSDEKSHKTTAVKLFGLEGAKEKANEYTKKALSSAERVPGDGFISKLTAKLLNREM
jgi:geranylgeranyl diphosphate synthase type II